MERKKLITFIILLSLISIPPSCSDQSLGIFDKPTPWESYSNKLEKADIDRTKAGRRWFSVAQDVLANPPLVEAPFSVSGNFKAKNIDALAWALELKKGRSIQVMLEWEPIDSAIVFVDIFRQMDGFKRIFSFGSQDGIQNLEIEETGTYIIRLQPELMAEGSFKLSVMGVNTYSVFPVQGRDVRAVQSVFGDPRDGGRRKHEGIDIFADKGTPVVAPVSGRISSVRTGGLGGKTVWMRDNKRGHSLYFAHLDSQAVSLGTAVRPGDTLGFVGNTGNAKYTPPHLHFGVYSRGAFDPYPLVDNIHQEPPEPNISAEADFMQVNSSRANLRKGPGTTHDILASLSREEVVFVRAASHDWYHIKTPDNLEGFIHHSLLKEISPQNVAQDTSWVYVNPFLQPRDSMRVELLPFNQVGRYDRFTVLADSNLNVYYQPR